MADAPCTLEEQLAPLHMLPLGVFVLDGEYILRFWNDVFATWTRRPAAEVLGKDIRELYPDFPQSELAQAFADLHAQGDDAAAPGFVEQSGVQALTPEGEAMALQLTLRPISGPGKERLVMVSAQDVTELKTARDNALQELEDRRKVEEALRQSEAKLITVSYTALDAIVMIDDAGAVVFWNPAAERMFGYTSYEALDAPFYDLIVPERLREAIMNTLGRFNGAARGPSIATTHDAVALHKHGFEFPVEVSIAACNLGGKWHAVGAVRNISERREAENKLREMALLDGLTKVFNRNRFIDLAKREMERSQRYGRPLALLMLDADHFKKVNDNYGHATGDRVLQHFAQTCRDVLREVDLIGRLGGEEFAVLLPETALTGACAVAERLRQTIETDMLITERGSLSYTVSIGVAQMSEQAANFEDLLKAADDALYKAKNNGRNRVEKG